jgi:hypothetical protein
MSALILVLMMGLVYAHDNGNGNGPGFPGFPGFGAGLGDRDDDGGRLPIWRILRSNGQSVAWFSWLPNRRFAIYAAGSQDPVNHLVLDRSTGLVWQRSPSPDKVAWRYGVTTCGNLSLGNVRGWRVPTLQELSSLETPSNPTDLPTNHPFENIGNTLYWSATTADYSVADPPVKAYGILFEGGGTNLFADSKTEPHLLWCVRGGQGVDIQ